MPRIPQEYYGPHFDALRTKDARGDMSLLWGNRVSLTMPAESSHFDHLEEISCSSQRPFPIKFLSDDLKELKFPRGRTYVGTTIDAIGTILLNYPNLRWWLEADGLVVDKARPDLGSLSDFDRIAGPLMRASAKLGHSAPRERCSAAE